MTVLKNLYGFLADQNYLMGNPWVGVSMPRNNRPGVNASRSFTERQWAFIEDQLAQLPKSEATDRLVFAMSFLYSTGLRLSEAVSAKVGDLTWVEYPPGRGQQAPTVGWELTVEGKGGKLRDVIVPQQVVTMLQAYLALRGLGTDLNSARLQSTHLLGPIVNRSEVSARLQGHDTQAEPGQGIEPSTLYRLLKGFFAECGAVLAERDAESSARFTKASTHWLRHTHASHSIARGVPLEVAQANLGHASLATTTVYVTTEKERRMRSMQEAWR